MQVCQKWHSNIHYNNNDRKSYASKILVDVLTMNWILVMLWQTLYFWHVWCFWEIDVCDPCGVSCVVLLSTKWNEHTHSHILWDSSFVGRWWKLSRWSQEQSLFVLDASAKHCCWSHRFNLVLLLVQPLTVQQAPEFRKDILENLLNMSLNWSQLL